MYCISVHVMGRETWMDKNVSVNIQLPFVPRKGECLYLSSEHRRKLEEVAFIGANKVVYQDYFYGKSRGASIRNLDPKDLSFSDAIIVSDVAYMHSRTSRTGYVIHIELSIL